MQIEWSDHAWDDMLHWVRNDRKLLARIIKLLDAIQQDPFDGIGKPEPLKNNLAGFWSRRINDEHRLVYRYVDGVIQVAKARYHY